jgi:hypothetical protein
VPQRCSVCDHPERRAIDKALAIGHLANRAIALRYGLTRMALWRHKDDHLPAQLVKAQEAIDVRAALDVVQQLKAINAASLEVLHQAREQGRGGLVLFAVDRIQKQIELQAKLLGELDDRPTINLTVAPEWLLVRAALLEALSPYPEARVAVATRLRALEAG